MTLSEQITADMTGALKKGDKTSVSVLRMIKSSMKNREIDKQSPLNDEDVQAILRTFIKRSREAIEKYAEAGREELAEKERQEMAVVQAYLPEQLGEDDIRQVVSDVISEINAAGPGDMGRVMKAVMARLHGQGDGRIVNTLVKGMLNKK